MGSGQSRCLSWACTDRQRDTLTNKRGDDNTRAFLKAVKVTSEETPADSCPPDPYPVSKPLQDFAQKMSQDIIAQALLLCWELEIHYKEFPFIDIECEYTT